MEIKKEISQEIMQHLHKCAKFVDCDTLREEWRAGISFLYDFGLVSLADYAELYDLFPEE